MAIAPDSIAVPKLRAARRWAALAAMAGVVLTALLVTHYTLGATIAVTTTNDTVDGNTSSIANLIATPGADGVISLREAITASNNTAGGPHTINFNISGCGGVCTITPTSALPTITRAVIIDGWSQPGWTSAPLIELNGTSAGGGSHGLYLNTSGNTIRGLAINRFGQNGIYIYTGANNNTIQGNYIGLGADGSTAYANGGSGILVFTSSGNTIGGTAANTGNVISSNGGSGVYIDQAGSSNNALYGNIIGLASDGSTDRGNTSHGVFLSSVDDTQIGDGTASGRNVISGNGANGVYNSIATNTVIIGNYIGTNAAGTAAVANAANGVSLFWTSSVQIGGSTAGHGNVISGNTGAGIGGGHTGTTLTIQGNYIGTNAAGSAAIANGANGIDVSTSVTIGGTAAGAGNLISGNTGRGIFFNNTAGSGFTATVQGNYIGTDATGVSAITNGQEGVWVYYYDNTQIGGTTAAARNVILAAVNRYPLSITGPGTHAVEGNHIGANVNGDAVTGHFYTVLLESTTNTTLGGTASGAGNLIRGSANQGVFIWNNTTRAALLGNQIHSNGNIGIDIAPGGVTANNGTKSDTSPNRDMDYPVFTAASVDGTTLNVTGYVGSAAGQAAFAGSRVEVFLSSNDASGYGEGQAYLGYVTADGSGNFSGSFTVASAVVAGDKVTGTATDTGSPPATSEFGPNFTVTEVPGIRGTVFEDRHYGGGAGRSKATALADGGAGRESARVELYDNAGAYVSSTTTDADGNYRFSPLTAGTYTVRVVNETVQSGRTGYTASLRAVQTFRTNASSGSAVAVTDRVGGETPNLVDAASNLTSATLASLTTGSTTAQSITSAVVGTGTIANVDFGFSFNVVVNTNDSGQGSLRQFLTNANALSNTGLAINGRTAGIDHALFMISNSTAAAGLRAANNYFSGGVASIAPTSALPTITEAVVVDAQTQPGWASAPIIELNGTSAGGGSNGLYLNISGNTIRGLAINRFGQHGIYIHTNANNNAVQGNYIGLGADGATAYANAGNGVFVFTSSSNTIGGTAANTGNVISANGGSGIRIDQGGSSNNAIYGNLIGLASDGSTDRGNTSHGIFVSSGTNTQIGDGTASGRNIVSGNNLHGIFNSNATNTTVIGNYIGTNAAGTAAVANSNHGIATFGTNSIQIGAATSGHGNLISGNVQSGISTANNASVTVQGNTIGANIAGTAAVPNGIHGIDVNSSITIGGTAVGAGNLIGGNTSSGIFFQNTLGSGYTATVQGNTIGLDSTGLVALHNGGNGIYINHHDHVTIGGTSAAARNVISASSGDYPLRVTGGGSYTIQGNYIGTDINGDPLGAGFYGVWLWDATNTTLGGTDTGAGNLIKGSVNQGVYVQGNTTRAAILGNNISGNGNIGIDIAPGGVTTNNGTKSEASPNRDMDYPVFTLAEVGGSKLYVAGYVGSAAGQATFAGSRVEVFLSDNDASGYGEGQAYLGYVTADGSGNFEGSFAVASPVVAGDKISGTATDTASPPATSEFGPQFTVTQAQFAVSGTVFEDKNYGGGAGRNRSTALADGGAVRSGARVELYDDGGDFVSSTTTNGSGVYSFSALDAGTYTVRVVNSTVTSSRSGYTGANLSVQTFRTDASGGSAAAVTDRVGGETPNLVDAASNLSSATLASLTTGSTTAQSISTVTGTRGTIADVDFGFSFNGVVNTNDSGQGSLRQFLTNANALSNSGLAINGRTAGIDHALFMISNGTAAAGLRAANNYFSGGVASIAPTSALPTITEAVVVDAQTQPGWASAPIVELNGTSAGGGNHGLYLNTSGNTIRGLAINRFGQNGIYIHTGANNNTIQGNYIGLGADGSTAYANGGNGVYVYTASSNTIGGTAANTGNVISANGGSGIRIDQGGSSNNAIYGNLIGLSSDGNTDRGNTSHGIFVSSSTNTQIGDGTASGRNVVSGNNFHGIYNSNATNTTVIGNYIGTNADGTAAVGNSNHGIGTFGTNSIQIGAATSGHGNLISGNVQSGISTANNTSVTVQGNQIGTNADGTAAVPNGIHGIDVNSSITIGGTAVGAGNLIGGNTSSGIFFQNTLGSGYTATVQGNTIGLDSTGLIALHNGGNGIYINHHHHVTIGGTSAAARNVISASSGDYPLRVTGGGTYTIQGNYIGTDINGDSLGAGFYGVWLWDATNTTLGGTDAGAGNLIKGSVNQGVYVQGNTTRAAILGNNISGNGSIGIDLHAGGVTANNGTKSEAAPNRDMDFPVITGAYYDGSTLYLSGYVGSAPSQSTFANARVEIFLSDEDASGYGEGSAYLGYLTADANGNFDGSFTPAAAVAVGNKITGTATDTGSPLVTSEFGANVTVQRLNFSGTVFEDLNYGGGAGRNKASALAGGGSGRAGARVELYDNTGAFITSTSTDASGNYRFSAQPTGTYTVRVVNETVTSARTGYTSSLRAVQTYRTDASGGSAADVTDHVGGQSPHLVDAGANLSSATLASLTTGTTTAQSITTVVDSGSTITGVDFGYSFNVVVNTNNSGQGSLRQFLTNANTLSNTGLAINGRTAGFDHALFMISNGTAAAGLRAANNYFSGGVASIAPTSALPTITEAVVINAQTQPGWTSAPIVELNGSGVGASVSGLQISASLCTVRGLIINRFTQDGIKINSGAGGILVQGNYIGTDATGLLDQGNTRYGISQTNSSSNLIGGALAADHNVVSGNNDAGIYLQTSDSVVIEGNYIGLGSDGQTAVGNTGAGIFFNTSSGTVGAGTPQTANIISANGSNGISFWASTVATHILGNTIGLAADGSTARGNQGSGISIASSSNVYVGSTSTADRNIISGNIGAGIASSGASSSSTIRGNYIGTDSNGTTAIANGNSGININTGATATIGGTASGAGNLISGNALYGIQVNTTATIQGNKIGTTASGDAALPNASYGIYATDNATIGGSAAGAGNQISGNTGAGIYVIGSQNVIQGNKIGVNSDASAGLANAEGIIFASSAGTNTVGGAASGAGNIIAHNTQRGVYVNSTTARVDISANAMYSNGALGIDLAPVGATSNNGSKSESIANREMDFPVFTNASYDGSILRVRGYIGSAPDQSVFAGARVEIFVSDEDASGYGEGNIYIGALTADGNGAFFGQFTTASVAVGNQLTATATDTDSPPATSEFGPNYDVRDYRPFRNGSFEDGALGATSDFGDGSYWALAVANTAIDYWVVENAAINAMPSTHWNASDGVRSIDLNHDAGAGAISQTFDTDVGTAYAVFVDYSGAASCGPTRKSLRISAAGSSTDVTDYLIGGSAVIPTLPASGRDYDLYYNTALFYFTAVTDLTTLKFESLSSGLCGAVIDNVRVQAADPFINGSFETGTDPGSATTLTNGSGAISGWLVGGHSIDYVGSQWTAADGSRSVELEGTGIGSIAQSFDALPEIYYRARFALSADPGGGGTRSVNVSAAATAESFDSTNTNNPLTWGDESFVFLATNIATTLDFASLSGSCCTGPVIDNVRLEVAYPFINGSFEDVRFPLRDSTDLTADNKLIRGWITSGASLQHWGNATFAASVGSYSVHLNGPSGAGAIEHTFDVEAGQSYDILFDAAANPALAADQTLLASIIDDGSTIATRSVTLNPSAVLTGQTRWRTQQISFTAVTSRVTLKLESQTAGTAGLAIDNVRYGVAGALNTTGQFNAFDTDTAADAVTGVIKTKIAGQAFNLDIAALRFDKTGYSNYPMSGIKIELLNAADNSAGLDDITNCRASWTPIATVTTSFELTGPDNGRKAQSFTVTNAYRNVRIKISYPGSGTATVVGCSNDNFAVRPAAFNGFTASDDDDSTAGTARVLNNSGAGGVVHRAGRPFSVVATAVDSGGSTVTSYDGTPQLAAVACLVPAGCTAGTLSGSASASAGVVTGNAFTYSEAGSLSVQLEDTSFADVDSGDSTQNERAIRLGSAAVLGRFIPDRYQLVSAASPAMAHGQCGAGPSLQSFTFTGQSFDFSTAPIVRAVPLNAGGVTLNNARPGFDASHVSTSFTASNAPVALTGSVSISSISASSDALIYYDTTGLSFARDANTPVASFTPTFNLTVDLSDTTEPGATNPINAQAALTINNIGFSGGAGNNVHFGRILLRSAQADLRSDLIMVLEVQRYTTLGWQVLTAAGTCISAAATDFAYSAATGLLNAGGGAPNCASRVTAAVTTAGGRASITLPRPTGGSIPSAMTVTLNVDAASGTSCAAASTPASATSAALPWLTDVGGAAPAARVSWGAPRSSYLLLKEKFD